MKTQNKNRCDSSIEISKIHQKWMVSRKTGGVWMIGGLLRHYGRFLQLKRDRSF